MATKPILFSGPMVRAILDGRKAQTRRIVKPPFEVHANGYITKFDKHGGRFGPYPAPYQPGDILWVRETWREWDAHDEDEWGPRNGRGDPYCYAATGDIDHEAGQCWRPSIHMPKWACRLWLCVTRVRVERLQEISGEDARSEGIKWEIYPDLPVERHIHRACLSSFRTLWDSINAKRGYGWDTNPWVWVYTFERIAKGGDTA